MYFLAIFIILSAFDVYFSHAGLVQAKPRLSQALAAENNVCPPGDRTCSPGKRLETSNTSWDTPVEAVKPSQISERACPPGVRTCSTGERSEITKEASVSTKSPIHKDKTDKEDLENCCPENWVGKKKRILKQMLKKATNKLLKLSQALEAACPPGVWTCSTGKR